MCLDQRHALMKYPTVELLSLSLFSLSFSLTLSIDYWYSCKSAMILFVLLKKRLNVERKTNKLKIKLERKFKVCNRKMPRTCDLELYPFPALYCRDELFWLNLKALGSK